MPPQSISAISGLSIIDDDDVYELLETIGWVSSHGLLLSAEEIFDLWAVDDSWGAPAASPFPAPVSKIGRQTGISGFDYEPDRPYVCHISTII